MPIPMPIAPTTDGRFQAAGRTTTIAFSPDGRILATGTDTPPLNVHLWRVNDGGLVRDIAASSGEVHAVAFSPNGQTLAVVGEGALNDGPVAKLFDVASGTLLRAFPVTCGFYADAVSFSSDGTLLATAGYKDAVEIWRASDASLVVRLPYATSVHNVHFSPSGSQLITGGVDRRATIWNVPGGTATMTLAGIADEMADAAFSLDGQQIISTSSEGNAIKLWDARSGALLQTLSAHAAYVSHVVWIDADHFVSNDWVGMVHLWARGAAGAFSLSRSWSTGGQSLGIAVSPDKTELAAAGTTAAGDGFFVLPL
jgi:WD40 repeat protein